MSTHRSNRLKIALLGAGGIAGVHVKGMLEHADAVECVALCDISDENLERRAEELGNDPARYHDWDTLLAEEKELDAVIIALPHKLHAPAILASARAGKHIMCEKPMCMTLEEADSILQAVAETGVTYMSAHNQLFTPVVREAKRRLDEGLIGELRWVRTQDCFVSGSDSMTSTWRGSVASQGGGELIDTGYHPSYLLLYLAGAPAAVVTGTMSRFHMNIEGEDTASVGVRFANGVIGEILTSWAMPLPYGSHQIHLVGDKGELFGSGSVLYHRAAGEKEPTETRLPEIESTFTEEIGHFAACLQQGARPLHGPEEGKAVLELILQATASAQGWQASAPKVHTPVAQ